MITAAHAIAFADDAAAARSFFRDVLDFDCVDAGGGWLIFALPPTELAIHPGPGRDQEAGGHRLFLMCDELEPTVADLRAKGVEFTGGITAQEWGRLTMMIVPGHGEVGLYEPRHSSPLDSVAD